MKNELNVNVASCRINNLCNAILTSESNMIVEIFEMLATNVFWYIQKRNYLYDFVH